MFFQFYRPPPKKAGDNHNMDTGGLGKAAFFAADRVIRRRRAPSRTGGRKASKTPPRQNCVEFAKRLPLERLSLFQKMRFARLPRAARRRILHREGRHRQSGLPPLLRHESAENTRILVDIA